MQHRLHGLRGKAYVKEMKRIFAEDQDAIRQKFEEIKQRNGGDKFTINNLGEICLHFRLPLTVMCGFLSDLQLLPVLTYDRLKDRGLKARDIGIVWKD